MVSPSLVGPRQNARVADRAVRTLGPDEFGWKAFLGVRIARTRSSQVRKSAKVAHDREGNGDSKGGR